MYFVVVIITIWLYWLLILLGADVKRASTNNCSICHWNLNSISAHSYTKLFLLKVYIAIHKFDIICISETYLDSSTTSEDDNFEISRYNLTPSDHPSNNKGSVICIYYKNFLLKFNLKFRAIKTPAKQHQSLFYMGVHFKFSSVHPNCHHQIVFTKLNLHIVFPPPFLREI